MDMIIYMMPYLKGQSDDPDWKSWQYTTVDGGYVPEKEIES